jgi:1-acyl-sn-glycerol-3-phosphate acyltransferase
MSLRWQFGKLVLTPLVRLALKLKVRGREHLSRSRPQIIACNHTSHIDPILVAYASGLETSFLAKEEIFRVSPAFAWLIRTYHAMPVSRGAGDLVAFRSCTALLGRGRSLVLFPEGTRSKTGELQTLRPGIAMLSIMNRVPIVPAFIRGVRQSFVPWIVDPDIIRWNERERPGRLRFRAGSLLDSRVSVTFGAAMDPGEFQRERDDYRRFTAALAERMAGLAQVSG